MPESINRVSVEAVLPKPSESFTYSPEFVGYPAMSTTGKGVKVCIIDSGVPDHTAIANIGGDINFCGTKNNRDYVGHSSIVAGLIVGNKPGEFVGMAPDAMAFFAKVIDDDSRTRLDSIVAAILWGTIKECDIICMGITAPIDSPAIHDAIRKANDRGSIVICSAGNKSEVEYPAKYAETLSVGSLTPHMTQATFSPVGDINLIGTKLVTTYVDQQYAICSGTSVSMALAAGVAARLVEKERLASKVYSHRAIYEQMKTLL